MFDYEHLVRQHNIEKETLDQILDELREEFPHDEMMVELQTKEISSTLSQLRIGL